MNTLHRRNRHTPLRHTSQTRLGKLELESLAME